MVMKELVAKQKMVDSTLGLLWKERNINLLQSQPVDMWLLNYIERKVEYNLETKKEY